LELVDEDDEDEDVDVVRYAAGINGVGLRIRMNRVSGGLWLVEALALLLALLRVDEPQCRRILGPGVARRISIPMIRIKIWS